MTTRQQAIEIIEKLKNCRPMEFFLGMNDINSGMGFILINLYESKNGTYASSISEKMKISRARVAILLKKLQAKNLITKEISSNDTRKEVLKITNLGRQEVETVRNKIINKTIKVIDTLGIEKVNNFIALSTEIKNTIQEQES